MTFELDQSWLPQTDPRCQPGRVSIDRSREALLFRAELSDTSIVSWATGDDQPFHLLGDTLEIFLMAENAAFYVELHVSPQNYRAHLRWPLGAIGGVREGRGSIEDFRLKGSGFESETLVRSGANRWDIMVRVPAHLLDLEEFRPGQRTWFSVSRYDYSSLDEPPVHSSTSPHRQLDFHRFDDWQSIA
ncbi:MAG TPA: hypothetical protein VIT21_09655 [Chthoniobacterales bacterium]